MTFIGLDASLLNKIFEKKVLEYDLSVGYRQVILLYLDNSKMHLGKVLLEQHCSGRKRREGIPFGLDSIL